MVKRSSGRPRLVVTADGTGVAAHVGSPLVADMAHALRLTEGLSATTAPTGQRRSAHDPGQVLVDLAVSVADGGRSMSDLKVPRNQPEVFGRVAADGRSQCSRLPCSIAPLAHFSQPFPRLL